MNLHPWQAARVEHDPRGSPSPGVPETVRIKLLGGFRVLVGSRAVGERGWRLKKAASLVKLLALEPHHRMHREQVIEWLWLDLDPRAAVNNLHYALYVARRILEPTTATASHYLQLRRGQLTLCPEGPLWIDVEAFEEAAATARRTSDPMAYRAAVDLYAGDLLPSDRYEAWAEDRREGLQRLYLGLLIELAGLCEERGDHKSAIEALIRAVTSEPTYEEAHARLMRLYAASGRRHEATLQYEQLRKALEELGIELGEASWRLYEEIRAGRLPAVHPPIEDRNRAVTPPHNLPVARTSLVGREREVVEVKRNLAMTRLLTLTGTGGSGKTRLALEVARKLVEVYPDGVWLAELAPLSEETLVPQTVAAALGVCERPGRPLTNTLVDTLREKKMLLMLDNCEHLIDAVAWLVEQLLDSCPGLRVLATSREALGVVGELVWGVPALSVPDASHPHGAGDMAEFESVRLFVERARYRRPAFALTPQNAQLVAEICRRLDGIPLAIELAAARVGVLDLGQITARLESCLKLLTGSSRAAPKQQTLRGALDWSYELLSEPERKLFARHSVFVGGWTLEAAEAVGAADGIEQDDVLDLLSRLVDKSLVIAGTEEAMRYRMLEPVRQYGRERLEKSGEAERAQRRHALWYLELAEEAEPKLVGVEQAGWMERLEEEYDNLRTALRWFLEGGEAEWALRLAGALGEFWRIHGYLREGLSWLEAALTEEGEASSARAKALAHAGWLAWERLDFERSTAFSEEALELSRKLGDKKSAAIALHNLGMVAIYDHMRSEEARALFEESLTLWRELGDMLGASRMLQRIGLVSVVWHDFERAATLYEESLALARKVGNKVGISLALWLGALASLGQGDHERVRVLCEEALDLARQVGHMHAVAFLLHVVAASAGSQGLPVRSARLWGATESLLDALGSALGSAERYFYGPYIAAAQAQLDESAWEAAWAEGKAMRLEEAVGYALSEEEEPTVLPVSSVSEHAPAAQPLNLTRREKEVAALVARELTNRRIASKLVISERTVDKHVTNILKKLGLSSREQVAAYVAEQLPAPR